MKNVLKIMDEEIELLKRYREVLQKCHTQYPLYRGRVSLCPAVREARELYGRVKKIYGSYRVELGLEDKARYLHWMYMSPENMSKIGFNPLQPLSECIDKLEALRYKKNRELFQKAQTTQREEKGKETPAPQVEQERGEATKPYNAFNPRGDFWEIVYKGKELPPIKNLYGFHYIHRVLYDPDKRRKALEIYQVVVRGDIPVEVGKYEEGLSISSNLIPSTGQQIMDSLSRKDIERAIEECKEKIEEANEEGNIEEKEDLEKELQKLKKHLSSGAGLANKPRKFPGDNERARKTVKKAIDKALEAIKKHDESLYAHLDKSITRGAEVYYRPIEPTTWE